MAEPSVFEICFPAHISKAPVCRPGETVAGVVVLKLSSPLVASHLMLKFCGVERVRRTPVSAKTEISEKRQHQSVMSTNMVMEKVFFRKELLLWGEPKISSMKIVPCDKVHRFHFSFTMPLVNMPTPRQTPDIEISYALEASLFTEVYDQQRNEKVLRDVHKTASKCFQFEPVLLQRQLPSSYLGPLESVVAFKDAALLASSGSGSIVPNGGTSLNGSDNSNNTGKLASSFLPFHSSAGKTYMNMHVFHPTVAYLPGEAVEMLILIPGGKKVSNAYYQVRENVRCRKSSAPVIDESEIPLLWRYSVDLTPPRELAFNKLSKNSITQDLGTLGRFVFTNHQQPAALNISSPTAISSNIEGPQTSKDAATSGGASSGITKAGRRLLGKSATNNNGGLAISNLPIDSGSHADNADDANNGTKPPQAQHSPVPLSPLAESQEYGTGAAAVAAASITDQGGGDPNDMPNEDNPSPTSSPPISSSSIARGRTGSLGAIFPAKQQQQQQSLAIDTSSVGYRNYHHSSTSPPAAIRASRHQTMLGNHTITDKSRINKNMAGASESTLDDSTSERSSISDTLSIRYQPSATSSGNGKSFAANFSNFARGGGGASNAATSSIYSSSSTVNGLSPSLVGTANNSGCGAQVTPVPLGMMLAKGSYKFAKVQFTLPPMTEMSPVSSAFLDFEYTVDFSMMIGSSFGTTKKTAGRLPLKIATIRRASTPTKQSCVDAASQTLSEPMVNGGNGEGHSTRSLHDSLSCLNLSIAHSEDNVATVHNGTTGHLMGVSPANTLTEFNFDNTTTTSNNNSSSSSTSIPGNNCCNGQASDDDAYPGLLSFVENGEKIPVPELEVINIGSVI